MVKEDVNNESYSCSCTDESQAGYIVFLPCSGGSNCGQIANKVAIELTQSSAGSIYCLAGIGAHINGMIEYVKNATRVVAIDGCPVSCARKTIEHAGLSVTDWICITELGIVKNHEFDLPGKDIELVSLNIIKSLRESVSKG